MNPLNRLKKRRLSGDEEDDNDDDDPCKSDLTNTNTIDDLADALLEEIFVRLHVKSAHRCKSVSKRWFSIISTPWFIRSFVHHQITINNGFPSRSTSPLQLTHIPELPRPKRQEYFRLVSSPDHGFGSDRLSLNFLPCYDHAVRVVGSSNDLLLCRVEDSPRVYYVCNPFMKQWVEIPLAPGQECCAKYVDSVIGFMCDPIYKIVDDENNGCQVLDFPCRYRVVRCVGLTTTSLNSSSSCSLKMEIFSSETGQWSKLDVSCPRLVEVGNCSDSFVSNGKLHWMCGTKYIFAYDPFNHNNNNNNIVEVIDRPVELMDEENVHLGVCRGRLRLLKFFPYQNKYIVRVWELEDYSAGKWCEVLEPENTTSSTNLFVLRDDASINFHPFDGNIIYLCFSSHVQPCNMDHAKFHQLNTGREAGGAGNKVFSLVQPWWPTPVSSLLPLR